MTATLAMWLVSGAAQAETWTLRAQVVTQAQDPHPLSRTGWQDVVTTSWAVLDLTRDGTDVRWTTRVCGIETSPVRGVRTEFSEAFVDGLPVERWSGVLDDGSLVAGPSTTVYGATTDDLGRATDADGDGQQGVTVRVSHPLMGRGDVYVAQRSTTSLSGEVQPDGRIVGVVSAATQQQLYGASRWWLRRPLPQRAHPDPTRSWFEMTPAEAGSTCAAVAHPDDFVPTKPAS